MKVNKSQAVMLILFTLLEKKSLTKEEIKETIDIADISFKRYMQEIRAFLANFDIGLEVIYNRKEAKYYIKNI